MGAADSSAEWRLLELVSVATEADERFERARALTRQVPLDSDRLVGMAVRHSLAPLLAHFLQLADQSRILPVASRRHLRETLERNRHRTRGHVHEALRITHQLQRAGLVVAVTKGVAAQATLYDQNGTRWFNDMDLMVLPEQRFAVADVLRSLGYQEGKAYHHPSGQVVDIPRSETVAYRLYPDHLPHLTRVTGDDALPYFVVDVAFSLTWFNSGWRVPTDRALAHRGQVAVHDGRLPVLDPVFDFLFLCLHLFREGWLASTIAVKDLRLAQFADICRHWERRSQPHCRDVKDVIDRFNLHAPIGWVTGHTDTIFATAISRALGLDDYTAADWLGSACERPGTYLQWPGTMRRRLAEQQPPRLTPHAQPGRIASLVPAAHQEA